MHKVFSKLAQSAALLLVLLFSAGSVYAQAVTVNMANVTGRVGTTVTVPVTISGVASNINSFGFTVTPAPGITFNGITSTGSLEGTAGFSTNANTANGQVGGFSQGTPITTSGTLVFLNFTLGATNSTGTVTLNNFQLNAGTPTATVAPAFTFTAATRIMSVSDHNVNVNSSFLASVGFDDAMVAADNVNSFSVTLSYNPAVVSIDATQGTNGIVNTGTLGAGWTFNVNDNGTGTAVIAGFGPTLTGTGAFFNVAMKATATAGTSSLALSGLNFQAGSPVYGLKSGTVVTVSNAAPVATAGTLTTAEDTAGNVTLTGTDSNGDALTFAIASQPANGTVTLAGAVATYTPNANYNGADSFTFTASDGIVSSAAATVSVAVTPVNDAPTVANATLTTLENTAGNVTLVGADIDLDALTYSATNGANGTVTVAGNVATYTPNANFSGTDTFTFMANDGTVNSAAGTVTVTVTQVNSAPVASGIGASTLEDTPVAVTFSATDADSDALTFSVVTQPTKGTLVVAGNTATYTPNANVFGVDTFTYKANDGTVDSLPATVTINVVSVNDVPTAGNVAATTTEDTAVAITLTGADADGDALTFVVVTAPTKGAVVIAGSTATYTPNANYHGADSFTYVANDGTVNSAVATVTVAVGTVNDVPVADAKALSTDEDTAGTVTLSGTDSDGDALTFTVVTQPTNGTVALNGAVVTYTPAANYHGADSFTYVANDGTVNSAPATVSITVASVNDAPVFTAQLANTSVSEDSGNITFTYTATDADGDVLAYTLTAGPFGATLDGATGAFSFNPQGNAGSYPLTVTVSDGTASVASTAATITVYAVNSIVSPLSGVHQVGPVVTPGSGTAIVRLVEGTNTLEVSGSFKDLAAAYGASHIHMGGVGRTGGAVITLAPTVAADGRSGVWSLANNTFDLSAVTYTGGVTKASFIAALKSGGAYVNVHSSAHGSGEIRGQLLGVNNAAPNATAVNSAASIVIAGSPTAGLIPISWIPATDPNGNPVQYLFEMATEASFENHLMFESLGVTNGFLLTVGDAARLYDEATNSAPGSVSIGGMVKVFMRVTTTDGSLWSVGATKEMELTRGLVTDSETQSELPGEFTLQGNYPNPFNPSTTIKFDLPQTADVNIVVVDLLGREVLAIPAASFDAGSGKTIQIDASSLSSGVYMYRLVANMQKGVQVRVGTMTMIK